MKYIKNTVPEQLKLRPLWQIFDELDKNITQRGTEPKYKIGLGDLDEILWGLHKQEVLTIGARTSHGKSALVTHLLCQMASNDLTIIDFTIEMTEEQMCERMITHICEIDNIKLRQGHALSEYNEKKKLFRSWAIEKNVLLTNKYGRTFDDLLRVCDLIKPDFVIVDYIQMVKADGMDKKAAIEDYLIRIGELAKDMNFGVINISQLNRGSASEDKSRPHIHHLKWSGVLEEFSDSGILLSWDSDANEYTIYVEKQRHGEVGKIQVKFMPEYNKFREFTLKEKDEMRENKR